MCKMNRIVKLVNLESNRFWLFEGSYLKKENLVKIYRGIIAFVYDVRMNLFYFRTRSQLFHFPTGQFLEVENLKNKT